MKSNILNSYRFDIADESYVIDSLVVITPDGRHVHGYSIRQLGKQRYFVDFGHDTAEDALGGALYEICRFDHLKEV